MLRELKNAAAIRSVLAFNQYERDRWMAGQAKKIASGAQVLDVGAGSCPYRDLFAHCDYKAHDFVQLQPGQLLGRKGYGRIDYVSDINSIPVLDGSFDVLICTEVLEHVPEPARAIREFARVLRPGGKLLLTAPLGSGLHQQPYHFYGGYTPFWYQRILPEAGFGEFVVQANGGFFRHYAQESVRFAQLLSPWRSHWNLIFLPIWIAMLPWCMFAGPLLAPLLDRTDETKEFTVGYFVSATRTA